MSNKIKEQVNVTTEQVSNAISGAAKGKAKDERKVVETLYTREEILAQASAFGVTPEVIAGALFFVENEQVTRRQVQEAIEKFKKREVK